MDDTAAMDDNAPMPDGLMDNMVETNMDDLFGDAADNLNINVPLPPIPLPAPLVMRLSEMQRTGCCTKLAWSNTGAIARIAADGKSILISTLFRDRKTGQYEVSQESKYPIHAPASNTFQHIQFNGMGLELVAFDSRGGPHFYSISGNINRMQPNSVEPAAFVNDRSDLDRVVGCAWLRLFPMEFQTVYITPATRTENGYWNAMPRTGNLNMPRIHHPDQRRHSLLCVTTSGKLTLIHQHESGIFQTTSVDLELSGPVDDLITHAAFGERDDHMILATHDTAQRMKVYKVSINWNAAQPNRNVPISVSPVVEVGHLTMVEHVGAQHFENARLSTLKVLSTPPAHTEVGGASTSIVAVFTHAPSALANAQPQQDAYSIIARWSIELTTPNLHTAFTKLKPNGPTPVLIAVSRLKREDDIWTSKLIVSIDLQYLNTLVAMTASDGTLEYRDRLAWETIDNSIDTDVASSLAQSGFSHPGAGEHHIQVAPSPDGSHVAFIKANGKLGTSGMIFPHGWTPLSDGLTNTKAFLEAAVACLARQYSFLSASNAATDEVLALLPPILDRDMKNLFTRTVLKTVCRTIDFCMMDVQRQAQLALRETVNLARPMGALLVLGTEPGLGKTAKKRDFSAQFAYLVLNMRQIGMALIQALTPLIAKPAQFPGGAEAQLSKAASEAPSVAGLIRWIYDLMAYIFDILTEVKRDALNNDDGGKEAKAAFEKLTVDSGTPALQLLLCSSTRSVLTFLLRQYLPGYLAMVQKIKDSRLIKSLGDRQALLEIYDCAKGFPCKLPAIVEFMLEWDSAVRNAFTQGNVGESRRVELELGIITEGLIPEELVPALDRLFRRETGILAKLEDGADMAKLYYMDTSWLGISGSSASDGRRYDAVRKTVMRKGVGRRVCRRCGAETEDVKAEDVKLLPTWLQMTQRHCSCGNYWWVE
ncbi:Mediator complex subunit 16 [Teratosphaeria destructans]|uniref:Mediator of RNA polymerase II transcription subunit 16 n=1 Tax=Teratosphaeria destructans TaxID=418781 RepID=A0A9W7W4S5_9PEZI|nr:Mediator complex subunit 16 [Teratosphaeria destructans]